MGHKQNPKPEIWEMDYLRGGEREVMEWETLSVKLKTAYQNATYKWMKLLNNLSNKNNYEKHILRYSAVYVRDIAHREVKEYFVTSTKFSNRL